MTLLHVPNIHFNFKLWVNYFAVLTSVPEVGELPSATGVKAFLPSGVAGTTEPFGTLAEMLEVPA